jgi:hypothetical protein
MRSLRRPTHISSPRPTQTSFFGAAGNFHTDPFSGKKLKRFSAHSTAGKQVVIGAQTARCTANAHNDLGQRRRPFAVKRGPKHGLGDVVGKIIHR